MLVYVKIWNKKFKILIKTNIPKSWLLFNFAKYLFYN